MNHDDIFDLGEPFFSRLITHKHVCEDCLNDQGLKKYLREQIAPNNTLCSYCSNDAHTVEVSELQRFILKFFPYGKCGDEQPWDEGEYVGINHDQYDTLEMFLGDSVCDELYNDLNECLVDELYCQDNWAALTPAKQRIYQWQEFQKVVKPSEDGFKLVIKTPDNERNHDEPHPDEFYNALAVFLLRADALSILPEGAKIHRVQWGHIKDDLDFSRLTCPPDNKATANRFSPEGVSMFYGSQDIDTACLEIKATKEDEITHAEFTTKQDLALIDFTATKFPLGRFDSSWIGNYHVSEFLKGFLEDIRKEVKGEGKKSEYIPTQAICHFFKETGASEVLNINQFNSDPDKALQLINEKNRIDGFCYQSSKGTSRTCYVLFYDNKTSADILELSSAKHTTSKPSMNIEEQLETL